MSAKYSLIVDDDDIGKVKFNIEHPRRLSENVPCLHCKTPCGENTIKCFYCKIVSYCSEKCRIIHWIKHKDPCERYRGTTSPKTTSTATTASSTCHSGNTFEGTRSDNVDGLRCYSCKKQNPNLRKCTKCKFAQYCNAQCQREHWPEHKMVCGLSRDVLSANEKGEAKTSMASKDLRCFGCKKRNPNVKKCSKCLFAGYCNAQCQKEHWSEHKMVCGLYKDRLSETTSGVAASTSSKYDSSSIWNGSEGKNEADAQDTTSKEIESLHCFYCKKHNPDVKKCLKCKFAHYCDVQCQRKDWSGHKTSCEKYPNFVGALSNMNVLLSNLHEMSVTNMVLPPRIFITLDLFYPQDTNAILVEIVGPNYHFLRHGVYIQDVKGETVHILFYHKPEEELGLLPSTMGQLLARGNFIRLFYPRWHRFADGTIGFRINSLDEIEFVSPKFFSFKNEMVF